MKHNLKQIAAITALSTAVGMGGHFGAEKLGILDDSVEISRAQTLSLSQTIRLGRMGLEGFNDALSTDNHVENRGKYSDWSTTNVNRFAKQSFPLGKSVDISHDVFGTQADEHFGEHTTITPRADNDGTYITYRSASSNMRYSAHESAEFFNPNRDFFVDKNASPKEVSAFYKDPETVVNEATYYCDDLFHGVQDSHLELRDNHFAVSIRETDEFEQDKSNDLNKVNPVPIIKEAFLLD